MSFLHAYFARVTGAVYDTLLTRRPELCLACGVMRGQLSLQQRHVVASSEDKGRKEDEISIDLTPVKVEIERTKKKLTRSAIALAKLESAERKASLGKYRGKPPRSE